MKEERFDDQIVVVSGLGMFTPLGRNADEVCDAVLDGRSSIAPSVNIDQTQLVSLTSEFRNDDTLSLPESLTRCTDRGVWFAVKALDEAMANAGLTPADLDAARTAVVVGTSHSGIQHSEKILKASSEGRIHDIRANDFYAALTDHVSSIVCERLGLSGIKVTISSACSSSNTAIGYGRDLLLTGQADRVIVIGTDTLSETIAAGFNSLKVMSKAPAAPFSNPSGISLGEGAGVLILESLETLRASARADRCRGEVLGYALSSDAFHPTSVDENGEGIQAAIARAIANSGITAADVDYISAHGTGTDSNDVPESVAVARLFGNQVKIASVKSSVGHTLGASGVIELIISLVCAERGYYAPNNHFVGVREGCADLDYVHGRQSPAKINTILCNNYGFGGNNSSVVLSREVGRFAKQPVLRRKVFVSAYSNYTAHSETQGDWVERIGDGVSFACNDDVRGTYVGKTPAPDGDKSSARRSSPSIQFAVQAMEKAITGFGLQTVVDEKRYETGLVSGLLHGAQKAVEKYIFSVYEDGLRYARSMLFPLTTLNAAAGEVSIKFGIKGFNTTLCGPIGAMKFAYDAVKLGHQERMFDLSSDELTPLVLDLCERFGVLGKFSAAQMSAGFYLNDGASVTVLESEDGIAKRGGKKLAEVLSFRVAQEGAGHQLNGDGAVLAATAIGALNECGLRPQDVDLVVGVGQGTQVFLDNERNALSKIFAGSSPAMTSAAMHLGYSPTAIFLQMMNLASAILSGAAWREADRSGAVWTPGALNNANGVARILVLFTSVTFEQCAVVLGRVPA
jgi:3-oxoacyl-[acyl-carrier-protein] synthase II